MATTEVEKRRPIETALLEMQAWTQNNAPSSFEIQAKIADAILSGQSVEEIVAAAESGPEDLSDLLGLPFRFIGGSLNVIESAEEFREGTLGKYVVFSIRDYKGVDHTISTGATNVVVEVWAFMKQGLFDTEGELSKQEFVFKSGGKKNTFYWIGLA